MNQTILFILASVGMTHIIMDGSILQPLRNSVKKLPDYFKKIDSVISKVIPKFIVLILRNKIVQKTRLFLVKTLPKKIKELFECYMCLGFWCGMIIGAGVVSHDPIQIFACGCAGSLLSQLTAIILNLLEAAIIKLTSTE